MTVKANSQNAKILRALSDGGWHTTAAIHRKVGSCRLNSCISKLRKKGFMIIHEPVPGKTGPLGHRYRLENPPTKTDLERLFAPKQPTLDRDKVPRDKAHRYRIYRLVDDELDLGGSAATGNGVISELRRLGRSTFFEGTCLGLLDTHGTDKEAGTWILNPWDATL
jgi:hypothetical protein